MRLMMVDSGAFDKVKRRFWKKVVKGMSIGDCWEWVGGVAGDYSKYGEFWFQGRMHKAHRISWLIHFMEIPGGLQVLHECDNTICVHPLHLFLGTNDDNMKDKVSKNRQSRLKGSDNPFSSLSEEDVVRMRRLYATGNYFQKDLAGMFGIKDVGHVGEILRGLVWSHVTEGIISHPRAIPKNKRIIRKGGRIAS